MPKSRTALVLRIEIADLYDDGRYAGRCTADEIAMRLQSKLLSVEMAFKSLGFRQVHPAKDGEGKGG